MNPYCKALLFDFYFPISWNGQFHVVVGWFNGTDVNTMLTSGLWMCSQCNVIKKVCEFKGQTVPNDARIRRGPDVFTHNSPAGRICLRNGWCWCVFGIRRRYLDVFPPSGHYWWIMLLYPACLGRDVTMATLKRLVCMCWMESEAFVTEKQSIKCMFPVVSRQSFINIWSQCQFLVFAGVRIERQELKLDSDFHLGMISKACITGVIIVFNYFTKTISIVLLITSLIT